jgi:hypothetical protein
LGITMHTFTLLGIENITPFSLKLRLKVEKYIAPGSGLNREEKLCIVVNNFSAKEDDEAETGIQASIYASSLLYLNVCKYKKSLSFLPAKDTKSEKKQSFIGKFTYRSTEFSTGLLININNFLVAEVKRQVDVFRISEY